MEYIPRWYCSTKTNCAELENFDPELGTFGFIPKFLPKKLISMGIKKQKIRQVIAEIQNEIINVNHQIWLKRNKKLYQNKT